MTTIINSMKAIPGYERRNYLTDEQYYVRKMQLDDIAKSLHFAQQFQIGDAWMVHDIMYDGLEDAVKAFEPTYKDSYAVKIVGLDVAQWSDCYCSINDRRNSIRLVVLRADDCGLHKLMVDPHDFWLTMQADMHFDSRRNIISRELQRITVRQFDEYAKTMLSCLQVSQQSTMQQLCKQLSERISCFDLPESPVKATPLAYHFKTKRPIYQVDLKSLKDITVHRHANGIEISAVCPDGRYFKAYKVQSGRWLNMHCLDFEGNNCNELDVIAFDHLSDEQRNND